jgi:FixJ family two-component response regulator
MSRGTAAFLLKPFDTQELIMALEVALKVALKTPLGLG